jgi:hypothetical protein
VESELDAKSKLFGLPAKINVSVLGYSGVACPREASMDEKCRRGLFVQLVIFGA